MSASHAADFAAPAAALAKHPDGSLLLRSTYPLDGRLPLVTERLAFWADAAPARPAFVECSNGVLARSLSYRDAVLLSGRIALCMARYPLSPKRPLLIIADNGIDHALLRIAAMRMGVPFAPLSPNLLRFSGGPARLIEIVRQLNPGLICADDADTVINTLRSAGSAHLQVVERIGAGSSGWPALMDADQLPQTGAMAAPVGLDTVAGVFFTSGSTGAPKGVITTQRMISSNQAAIALLWPLLAQEPPRLLDWLPWHHTFGGNDNFNKMLWHGGTLYIDDGRPTAEAISRTVANIKAVRPTIHINVPRGLELLLDAMQADPLARAALLGTLRLIFFAGAGLSRATWKRLQSLVSEHAAAGGQRIALTSGWGSTECGSTICLVHFPIDGPNAVGLPLPGYELKLTPVGPKFEAWVRGPNVTPGYWPPGNSDRSAFDDEGFYRTGDAVRLLDADHPEKGLMFDGRVAEDFKLSTGTWVSVGPLRLALLAALAPLVRDVAIAGHDERCVAILVFLEAEACRAACGLPAQMPAGEIAASSAVRARIRSVVAAHNAMQPASSSAVKRLVLIDEPPSADAGEVNEKGHLNQRLALARREALVRSLFDANPNPEVMLC